MNNERELVPAHPEGEVQIAGNQPAESGTSLDTFAGKIYVKWAPEATVSSLGLMPFFIEFLKTTGLFDKWVEDCRIIATDLQAPRIYPRMIRLCSRFDSVLFTPKISEIPSYGNYSRFPIAEQV